MLPKRKKRSGFFARHTSASTQNDGRCVHDWLSVDAASIKLSKNKLQAGGPWGSAIELMAANAAISLQHFQNRLLGAQSQ